MQLYNQRILKMFTKNRLCLFIFMSFICSAASALQSDFKEMITVDSDKQFADVDNDHVIFTDNVEIHQGTIYIKASKVEVFRENPNKKGQHTKLIAYGTKDNLAVYEQTMDDGERIHVYTASKSQHCQSLPLPNFRLPPCSAAMFSQCLLWYVSIDSNIYK